MSSEMELGEEFHTMPVTPGTGFWGALRLGYHCTSCNWQTWSAPLKHKMLIRRIFGAVLLLCASSDWTLGQTLTARPGETGPPPSDVIPLPSPMSPELSS